MKDLIHLLNKFYKSLTEMQKLQVGTILQTIYVMTQSLPDTSEQRQLYKEICASIEMVVNPPVVRCNRWVICRMDDCYHRKPHKYVINSCDIPCRYQDDAECIVCKEEPITEQVGDSEITP
jgi:hypothetical protein